jgi:hypothetical protein
MNGDSRRVSFRQLVLRLVCPTNWLGGRKPARLTFEHAQVLAKGARDWQNHWPAAYRANDLIRECEIFAHRVRMDVITDGLLDADQPTSVFAQVRG